MAWEFPRDRRFDMQVEGFSTFTGCQWIEQDEDNVTVEYSETGGPVRTQLRLVDVRAIYRPAPVEQPPSGSGECAVAGATCS